MYSFLHKVGTFHLVNNICTRAIDFVWYCVRFISLPAFKGWWRNHLLSTKCLIISWTRGAFTFFHYIVVFSFCCAQFCYCQLTLKWLRGSIWPPCSFSKNVTSKERVKLWFFVNFIEFPQVVQKIWKNYLSILAIFINFPWFFGFFDVALLQRN